MNIKVLRVYIKTMMDNNLEVSFAGLKKFNAIWKYNILKNN